MIRYWLFKSEPSAFSIDDLRALPKQTGHWDGVRNYQVRNMLRDEIKVGDLAFFYHSSCQPPGIAGIVEIVKAGYPDHTAFDMQAKHFDPASTPEKPRWYMVDVKFKQKLPELLTLAALKSNPKLAKLQVLRPGSRLSITPVLKKEWDEILKMTSKL